MRRLFVLALMSFALGCRAPSVGSPVRSEQTATSAGPPATSAAPAAHPSIQSSSHVSARPPGRVHCPWSAGQTTQFWWHLDDAEQQDLLSKHVRGGTSGQRACQLSAMFSQVAVVWFDAKGTPSLAALPSKWRSEPSASPFSSSFFDEALPGMAPSTPPVEQDHLTDGEGNFISRTLLKQAMGGWVLIVDYAG
jgi:hypothetical protein